MKTDKRKDVHVLPIGDLREHEESRDCWCEPVLKPVVDEMGNRYKQVVVSHNSMDGRELVENYGLM